MRFGYTFFAQNVIGNGSIFDMMIDQLLVSYHTLIVFVAYNPIIFPHFFAHFHKISGNIFCHGVLRHRTNGPMV